MYLNAYQQYAAELIDEYGALLCRQILAAVNHRFGVALATFDGYAAQMCRYGDYEIKTQGTDCILCRKGDIPDYDIIHSFDVMAAFLPQVVGIEKAVIRLPCVFSSARKSMIGRYLSSLCGRERKKCWQITQTILWAKRRVLLLFFCRTPRSRCRKSTQTAITDSHLSPKTALYFTKKTKQNEEDYHGIQRLEPCKA